MVLLTSCFAFIGLKCEIANKYQEFLSFLRFLSGYARNNVAGATKLFTRLVFIYR